MGRVIQGLGKSKMMECCGEPMTIISIDGGKNMRIFEECKCEQCGSVCRGGLCG